MLTKLDLVCPPVGVLYIGAGSMASVDRCRSWNVQRACFVEADGARAQRMRTDIQDDNRFTVRHALVSEEPGEVTFFVASNRNESGLVAPQVLRQLWSNLDTVATETRSAITLSELFGELVGQGDKISFNWLIIDCLPALRLLRSAEHVIDSCDIVIARVLVGKQWDTQQPDLSRAALDDFMLERHFRIVAVEQERHPFVAHVAYLRDWKSSLHPQLEDLSDRYQQQKVTLNLRDEALRQQEKRLAEIQAESGAAIRQLAEAEKVITDLRTELQKNCDARESGEAEIRKVRTQIDMRQRDLDLQTQKLQRITADLESAQAILHANSAERGGIIAQLQATRTECDQLSAALIAAQEALDHEQTKRKADAAVTAVVEQVASQATRETVEALGIRTNEIRRFVDGRLANAVTQIEAYMQLAGFLKGDAFIPPMHGWPISPDFGLHLVDLVQTGNYRAVIEFGSGTSTYLIAKAIHRRAADQPIHFISFDHLEEYWSKTRDQLAAGDLLGDVRLELARLEPMIFDDMNFQYYSCETALRGMMRRVRFRKAERVLVVVDGPPADTGPISRYPALPMILNTLGNNVHFDIIIDDYGRKDEQEVVSKWVALLTKKSREFEVQELKNFEKQACLLSVRGIREQTDVLP